MIDDRRIDRHTRVATELALHSDRRLSTLVDRSQVTGTGIGGTSGLVHVDGEPVFVKRIRLTDLERRPGNVMSTANLFGLPAFCQYGVGSPGFGVWRELAASTMTTNWVLSGRTDSFPLLHHWRVLPEVPPTSDEMADVDGVVAYWGGSAAMRDRLEALAHACASVVLFVEFVPYTLADRLGDRTAPVTDRAALADQLLGAVGFMNAHGLLHFDAHFGNVLTDGHRIYLADLGLATSPRFDLSDDEARFLRQHRTHDLGYAAMRLVNWLVATSFDVDDQGRDRTGERIRAYAAGAEPDGVPATVADRIRRYAPVAAVMNDFYRQLFTVSRATPYPSDDVARALATARRPPGPDDRR